MPLFGLLPALSQTPQWSQESAKLGQGELAKVVAIGASMPVRSNATVMSDGTVRLTVTRAGRTVGYRMFRLTVPQMRELKTLIAATDFARLRSMPPVPYPPSAMDGLDELFVVRQSGGTVWWSDAVFEKPPAKVPLLERMRLLLQQTV